MFSGAGDAYLSIKNSGGVFIWETGLELAKNSFMWAPREPYNDGRCGIVWKRYGYYLNDVPCSWTFQALCEGML